MKTIMCGKFMLRVAKDSIEVHKLRSEERMTFSVSEDGTLRQKDNNSFGSAGVKAIEKALYHRSKL